MKTCLHCGETFQKDLGHGLYRDIIKDGNIYKPIDLEIYKKIGYICLDNANFRQFLTESGVCYKCGKTSLILNVFDYFNSTTPIRAGSISLFPLYNERPIDKNVPESIADDYKQATRISSLSTKGSATLVRRCLQATLRNKFPEMGKKPNLKQEIDWVIENGNLEEEINEVLHKLRDAGNFGAHPSEDGLTEIYDLSQDDLEACFLLLDHLFDIFYVQPAKRKEKLAKLKNIPSSKKT